MRIPESLESLLDHGVVDEVIRPLMSGKEAQVYLVASDGEERVAKVYKEAQNRTFKNRAEYTEGRKVRNSRDRRAMEKRSKHGKSQDESAWRSTEVDMIYRLRDAGVTVPIPYYFIDGVLIMELVSTADGHPAPRLGELVFTAEEAQKLFEQLLAEVVRMLSAGVVHGDLSSFNILAGARGPVIIDFPQAINAANNQNARKILLRDVDNLQRFFDRFAPGRFNKPYAQEMWLLYEKGELAPDSRITGNYTAPAGIARTDEVLASIEEANFDEQRRRRNMSGPHSGERRAHGQRHSAEQQQPAQPPGARPNRGAPPQAVGHHAPTHRRTEQAPHQRGSAAAARPQGQAGSAAVHATGSAAVHATGSAAEPGARPKRRWRRRSPRPSGGGTKP